MRVLRLECPRKCLTVNVQVEERKEPRKDILLCRKCQSVIVTGQENQNLRIMETEREGIVNDRPKALKTDILTIT